MAAVAAALLATACGGGGEGATSPRTLPVEVDVARRDTLSIELSAVGTLQAQSSAQVASEIDGTVSGIDFEEGSRVPTGKVLVQLDASKLRAALHAAEATAQQARTQSENLERQVQRNEGLLAQGAISKQAFDDLQSSYRSARAQVDQAEANAALARQQLADATIRAPFAGRVGERTFDVGDYVRKGDPLFTVTDDDTLQVRFTVPEGYSDRLHPGSSMQVKSPNVPGRWFDGQVYFVSPTVDPVNRSMTLKAEVPNPDGKLRSGSSADVRLVLERRSGAIVIPEAAIVPSDQQMLVYLVRDGKARRTPVQAGARTEGRVEILSGVAPGDTVVTAGQQRLEDGAPVRIEGRGVGLPAGGRPASDSASGSVPDSAGRAASDSAARG
ncbi:MAG: efflux RND transporter periplasmic adaptor subunit [Candidatus Palauibacterales bacterium]|nr:efflux RND transporter periplasmic adaptor subunit [Candidatus Palauibacterales bacterium]MDP2584077.1 efflux RND transporter periplasmic adaptor subunit [Candidatus Palauibacterales bacterium]